MKLWTIQPIEWYEKLLAEKIIYGERKYVEPDFLFGFEWLIKMMEKRIGKKPIIDCFPIWAWYQYLTANKMRPDLRESGHLEKGEAGVRVEIEKNESEVLLSDYGLWHYPLGMHCYIGNSEEDERTFETKLADKKLDDRGFKELPRDIQNTIQDSWLKIFDLNFDCPYYTTKKEKKSIQATFWSLSLDEVVKVDKFIAR